MPRMRFDHSPKSAWDSAIRNRRWSHIFRAALACEERVCDGENAFHREMGTSLPYRHRQGCRATQIARKAPGGGGVQNKRTASPFV